MPPRRDPATHVRIASNAGMRRALAIAALIHPAPALTVTLLAAALGTILAAQAGVPLGWRVALTVLAVAGSQVLTGAANDWADRHRDAVAQTRKPIPAGRASPRDALALAFAGGLLQVAVSVPLGLQAVTLGAVASASAVAYSLWLARTPLSVVPYLVSFGVLPMWVAAGVGVPIERVAAAPVLVAPFAAAAHLANALRDFSADESIGRRNLAQVLGRGRAQMAAWALAMAVGLGVGAALIAGGGVGPVTAVLGVMGLAAVAQGVTRANRLWFGMLVAAVTWTAAWALATG